MALIISISFVSVEVESACHIAVDVSSCRVPAADGA
jgi:hypothetical protein